ncbi:DUF1507 family protein [Gemelliphila palaticanis]|nr:DUF1507 family protein [Gemella palaticanis]
MNSILQAKVKTKINRDVKKIEDLIEAQLSIKKYRECPLYEDVIDTHIFGISKQLELAVEVGFINEEYSRNILEQLENKINSLYNIIEEKKVN